MTTSIKELKSKRTSALEQLQSELENISKKQQEYSKDTRYWSATVDKAGNGSAIIRFLPAPPGENSPFVKYWDHAFQGPGGWYIEKSLTTLGKDDPVAESNSVLWKSSEDDDSPERKTARERKRKLHYVSNVLVVKDPANPENDGKVFLFRYGTKIFEKITHLIKPDEKQMKKKKPVDPFDLWSGVNFYLDIRKVAGYANFDKCEWDDEPSAVLGDASDEEYERLWNSCYSLREIIDPSQFKSYEELQARFNRVVNGSGKGVPSQAIVPTKTSSKFEENNEEEFSDSPLSDSSFASDADDQFDFLNKLIAKVDVA